MKIDFNSIRASHNLIDVAARYCELKKTSGNEYECVCPFHNDTNPSCTFFLGDDGFMRYYCHACEAKGDVTDWVANINSVTVAEAARILTGDAMPANTNPVARPSIKPDETAQWVPIIPVPDDAPEYNPAETYNPKAGAFKCHKTERMDPYLDAAGKLICYVTRFTIGVKKITPVITFCEGPGGERLWCSKRMKEPYPVMGLDELAARPNDPVVIVSGEKCKVAATKMLSHAVVITTLGGDKSTLKNDLSVLWGRKLILWPDADPSGKRAMWEIGKRDNNAEIMHIDVSGLNKGYDVADLVGTGVSQKDFNKWVKDRLKKGNVKSSAGKPKDKGPDRGPVHAAIEPPSNIIPFKAEEINYGFPPEYSEDSIAEAFSEKHKDRFIYVKAWGEWMEWRENRWQVDETDLVMHESRLICKLKSNEAAKDPALASKSRSIATAIASRKMVGNVVGLSRSDPRHTAIPSQFDADPWVINTPGGIVDLKTGKMRKARRTDFASKHTSVSPGGTCPVWLKFLGTTCAGDKELMGYLQRVAGYCLTGSISEQVFFFCYGTGRNGKGTFTNTISWLLNTYYRNSNMDTFTEQNFSKHSAELAFFQGARLVTAQETEEGKRWNESRIKAMTGGDPITANRMRENPFTFLPTFKLLFAGNHKPALRNVDAAIKRRLHMIPFTHEVKAEDVDGYLDKKLHMEGGGILKWMIEGCLAWQKNGLDPPASVLATTEEYFESQDTMQTFIDDRCEEGNGRWALTSIVYKTYTDWARSTGEYALPRPRFLHQMSLRGIISVKRGGQMCVEGIDVVRNESDYQNYTDN